MTYTEAMLQIFPRLIPLIEQAIANHTKYLEALQTCKEKLEEQYQVCLLTVNFKGELELNVFEELCLFLQNFKNDISKIPPAEQAKEFSSSVFSSIYHLMAALLSNVTDVNFLSWMLSYVAINRLASVDGPLNLEDLLRAVMAEYRQQNKTLDFGHCLQLLKDSLALAQENYVNALELNHVEHTQRNETQLEAILNIEKSYQKKIKIIMCYMNSLDEYCKEYCTVKTLKQISLKYCRTQMVLGKLKKDDIDRLPSDLLEEVQLIHFNKS